MRKYHYIISEQCNMKCSYCNVDVDNLTKLSNVQFDNFYQTINQQEEYDFDIFGGEPFLQIKEVQHIINILDKDSRCRRINISTNGTVMNNSVKKLSKCSKLYITISYDGINQIQNRGNQTIHIYDFIELGVTHGHSMLVGEMFNTCSNNYLIDNHKHIEKFGITPDLTLVRDVGTWNTEQSNNFLAQFGEYVKFIIPKINNDEYNFKTLPGLIRTYINAIFEYSIKNNAKTDCRCGDTYTSILPSGEIIPCERFKRNNDVYDIFKNKELKDDVMSACNTCEIRDVCHKGCIYEQLLNNGVIPELCAIYKGIVKELKFLLQETNHKLIKQFIKENGYARNTK